MSDARRRCAAASRSSRIELLRAAGDAAPAVPLRRRDGDRRAAGVRARAHPHVATAARATGAAAELMMPKWFDKDPARIERRQRRRPARARSRWQRDAYARRSRAAHRVRPLCRALCARCRERGERARHCRRWRRASAPRWSIARCSTRCAARCGARRSTCVRGERCRHRRRALAPDLADFDIARVPRALRRRARRIAARHTVGMLDALERCAGARRDDGLPAIARRGHRALRPSLFQAQARRRSTRRPRAPARDRRGARPLPRLRVTLDGNEQYRRRRRARRRSDRAVVRDAGAARASSPRIAVPRAAAAAHATLQRDLPRPRARVAAADRRGRRHARRVSARRARSATPACRARAARASTSRWSTPRAARAWNAAARIARYFMSGEDLTTQAGLAVQQDLALAALLGLAHVERNGHHYVDGFAGQRAGGRAATRSSRRIPISTSGATAPCASRSATARSRCASLDRARLRERRACRDCDTPAAAARARPRAAH